jgi:hypothetical protein
MVLRDDVRAIVDGFDGLLPLEPALVARSWMSPGRRLGLSDEGYDAGERGWICERWLASTTPANNEVTVDGEGVSRVAVSNGPSVRLDELMTAGPEYLVGADYASRHDGLGRLAKVFDYSERVPFHIHPPTEQAALAGHRSKDEAYYFLPNTDLGLHPEAFFGVHPSLPTEEVGSKIVSHLARWKGSDILGLSRGFLQIPEAGFFVPSGLLHAPGTALTFELQEDSDAMAMLQAECGEHTLSKSLLLKDISPDRVAELGDAAVLEWIDWDLNQTADIFASFHIEPQKLHASNGTEVCWIVWGSRKFAAKRLRLSAGASHRLVEEGAFGAFIWSGRGEFGGRSVVGGAPGNDEFLVTAERAAAGVDVANTGSEMMEVLLFFGPDIYAEVAPVVSPAR